MKHLKILKNKTTIHFLGKKWVAFILSIVLCTGSLVMLFANGLNFGIDFMGGVVIEIRTEEPLDIGMLRKILATDELGDVALQTAGSDKDIMIRIGQKGDKNTEVVDTVKRILSENITSEITYRKTDFVGPQVGKELITSGALSLGLAFVAIMLYIWMRFEWQFGIGAILALLHDVLLTLGLFSVMGLEFNLTSIAAVLTIIGYSINDSVVIYDRIRENLRKFKKMPVEELLDLSINDVLSRTVLTSGTTIAALIALVSLGGNVIMGFSIAVLFGIIVGTYSSIYIASPILVFMNIRKS